ncbi:MAG TPA: exonuclease SbcCD subunit D C-terminal domain-containing protein [Candidatus Competibacter sp.]|nr:exonuclease SbcCD subunit D C-terminal domain-containing protein [Candidatus Competibacter sp.]
MRLIHTSDWHLGQTFHDFDRSHEHRCFLNWLLDTLEAEQADALLIAGDVFDSSNPSADSQRQFYHFLTHAKRRVPDLDIVVIAGNHDSAGRLEAPAPLLEVFDATAIGYTRHPQGDIQLDRLVVPLRNRDREIAAWCLAIPFLRPGDVPRVETDGDPYPEGVKRLYQQVLEIASNRRQAGQAIVALGHCHMSGGQTSEDSERPIVIGGLGKLPVEMFDPAIAYVALGHLHRAQDVGGQRRVRYSGSPLPMSFTEIRYHHQVVRIDLDGDSIAGVMPIPVPRFVQLLQVPKQPAPIDEVLDALKALDLPDAPSPDAQPYLQVRVRSNTFDRTLRARIESILEKKPVRLASIERSSQPSGDRPTATFQSIDDIKRLQPDGIFRELCSQMLQREPPAQLLAAFTELLVAGDGETAP